ncbi:MAG TPA: hypothetical protein EYP25_14425, partial [Anaerolineae bacterium]|nr:hypothetical protein [Anaerolineae bacterium]
ANRFLHSMVRVIVGTMVEVGRGKLAPENIVEIVAREIEVGAGVIAAAGQAVAKVGVGEGEGLGQPLAAVFFAHCARQFLRVVHCVVVEGPCISALVQIGDLDGDCGAPVLIHPGVVDIKVHVGIAGLDVGAAGVTPLHGVRHMPFGRGFSAIYGVVLVEPEGEVAAGGEEIVFTFSKGHPHRVRVGHVRAQVVLGEFEPGRAARVRHQGFGEHEIVRMPGQARVDAPHGDLRALLPGDGVHALLDGVTFPGDGRVLPPGVDGVPGACFVVGLVGVIHQGEVHIGFEAVVFEAHAAGDRVVGEDSTLADGADLSLGGVQDVKGSELIEQGGVLEGLGEDVDDVHRDLHPQFGRQSGVVHALKIDGVAGFGLAKDARADLNPGDAGIVVITLGEGLDVFPILLEEVRVPIAGNGPLHGVTAHHAFFMFPDQPGRNVAAAAAAAIVEGKPHAGGFAQCGLFIQPLVHHGPVEDLVRNLDILPEEDHVAAPQEGIVFGTDIPAIEEDVDAGIGGIGLRRGGLGL